MDIRDFNYWMDFKSKCKNRVEENCKLKENGLCIFVFCPLVKFDREIDNISLEASIVYKCNGGKVGK